MHSTHASERQTPSHRAPRPPTLKSTTPVLNDARREAGQYAAARGRALSPAQVLALQQMQGNRAVSDLLQRKVTVGPADDAYEREADRVAAQVVSGPASVEAETRAGDASAKPAASQTGPNQGGAPLPGATRAMMETRFGADFSRVRVHAGSAAAEVNRSLGAEALTHQNHIYMGAGSYNPHTRAGRELLAHELTHVVQQTGTVQRKIGKSAVSVQAKMPGNRISTKKKKMYLDFIRMKRLDPQFDKIIAEELGMKKTAEKKGEQSGGTYGHWWTEIGDMKGAYPGSWHAAESYGWWPAEKLRTIGRTFKGVPGELNAGKQKDPHHGEDVSASQMFHPVMELDTAKADYVETRNKVIADVRKFSKGYSGKWNWVFGWGKNCHSFQQALKTKVGLHYQKGVGWFKKPDNVEGLGEAAAREQKEEEDRRFNEENPGVDFKLRIDVPMHAGNMFAEGDEVKVPAGSVVRVITEGIDFNRLQGWNKVAVMWNGMSYVAFFEDVTKHADRV